MSTYQELLNTIKSPVDSYNRRQQLMKEIEEITGRRLLLYVANPRLSIPAVMLSQEDKTGFSDLVEGIPRMNAVDIMINSSGGFAESAEALVGLLRSQFSNIRFAIPNQAKSAATLLCLSGDELLMDHRSELGPIDPQVSYLTPYGPRQEAAQDILGGFETAKQQLIDQGPAAAAAYVPLLEKYTIGLLRGCETASLLSQKLAETWLHQYMFASEGPDCPLPKSIASYLSKCDNTLSHGRPIGIDTCLKLGLKTVDLRQSGHAQLAGKLWELWCVCELHFERLPNSVKMYENTSGCQLQKLENVIAVPAPQHPNRPNAPLGDKPQVNRPRAKPKRGR